MNCIKLSRGFLSSVITSLMLTSQTPAQETQTFDVAGTLQQNRASLNVQPFDSLGGMRELVGIELEFDGFIDMEILLENFNSFELGRTEWFFDAGANMILAFDERPGFPNGGPFFGLGGVFETAITGNLSAGSGGDPPPFGNPSPGDVTVTADFSNDFVGVVASDASLNYFLADEPLQASISPFVDLIESPAEDSDGFIGADITLLDFAGTLSLTYNFVESLGRPEDCNGDGFVNIEDLNCVCGESSASVDDILSAANLIKGDLDADGTVAFADFLSLSTNFGEVGTYLDGDLDCSGDVAFADFLILSTSFGLSNQETQNAPEPALRIGWLLLVISVAANQRRRTRV